MCVYIYTHVHIHIITPVHILRIRRSRTLSHSRNYSFIARCPGPQHRRARGFPATFASGQYYVIFNFCGCFCKLSVLLAPKGRSSIFESGVSPDATSAPQQTYSTTHYTQPGVANLGTNAVCKFAGITRELPERHGARPSARTWTAPRHFAVTMPTLASSSRSCRACSKAPSTSTAVTKFLFELKFYGSLPRPAWCKFL